MHAQTPDHRLDIGEGVIGVADLMEEIARIYGYDRIPETRHGGRAAAAAQQPGPGEGRALRDLLVDLGLQEVVTYRLTSPEREARRLPPGSCTGATDPMCAWQTRSLPTARCCATACSPACWKSWSATPAAASAWRCSRSARCSWLPKEASCPMSRRSGDRR